jgi:hypothetical protein
MKFILQSPIFFSFIEGLPTASLTSDNIKTFQECFQISNYFEYSISFECLDIIFQLNLLSLDDLYQKLIVNFSTFLQLLSQHVTDHFFYFFIHSKPNINKIHCSLNCFDGKIVFIFQTVLLQYQQKHFFPKYISFITVLISEYFSQKLKNNKIQNEIFSEDIIQINNEIIELINQNLLDTETLQIFIYLRFDLILDLI